MKVSIDINQPINKVVELFMSKEHFTQWKRDFVRYEPITGEPGDVGSVTRLVGKRGVMLETIIAKNLPSEIVEQFEHIRGERTMMIHRATNRFVSLAANKTLLEVETEITRINGFLLKLIMRVLAGAGKKYSQDQLNKFKTFAEDK